MVPRDLGTRARRAAADFPVVTITGPRQSGKTTLCRALFASHAYASLEPTDQRAFANEDPRGFLAQFDREEGVVLDEIQRAPILLSYLQERVDDDPRPGRYVLTGSQHLGLSNAVSQSLAGRTAVLHLLPLSYDELRRFDGVPDAVWDVVFAGGCPAIDDRGLDPAEWLDSYVATYVERDVRELRNIGDLSRFRSFMGLAAGRTATLESHAALGHALGIDRKTAGAWLSVLERAGSSIGSRRGTATWASA